MGFASAFARVGSVLSAMIAALDAINIMLPVLIYGGICIASAFACFWINPETKDLGLPDTLADAEEAARGTNSWLQCCGGGKKKEKAKMERI